MLMQRKRAPVAFKGNETERRKTTSTHIDKLLMPSSKKTKLALAFHTQSTLPPLLARDTAICILLLDFLAPEGLVVSLKRGRERERERETEKKKNPPIDSLNAHTFSLSSPLQNVLLSFILFLDRRPTSSLPRRAPRPPRPRRRAERRLEAPSDARRARGQAPRGARRGAPGEQL